MILRVVIDAEGNGVPEMWNGPAAAWVPTGDAQDIFTATFAPPARRATLERTFVGQPPPSPRLR